MEIAANTKISALIKENEKAIEAIASINKHFEKLRNPLLRKLLASRVTIADAARIGGCEVEAFYKQLAPLGFTYSSKKTEQVAQAKASISGMPDFLKQLPQASINVLDVCEDIATGNDPFLKIMDAVDGLNGSNALLLINTFEPTPLITILDKKGYSAYTQERGPDDLVHTYFWRRNGKVAEAADCMSQENNFEEHLAQFVGRLKAIDVRYLEMPQPMATILQELEHLPEDNALYVLHRQVPQFLLPQLKDRGFAIAIKKAGTSKVYLLIYKDKAP